MLLGSPLVSRHHPPIETAEDVLASGLPVYLTRNTAIVNTLFRDSPLDLMRRIYVEGAVARGGLFSLLPGALVPAYVTRAVAEGTGIGYHYKTYELFDGDVRYYSKKPFSNMPTTFVVRKNHWIKVSKLFIKLSNLVQFSVLLFHV